MVTTRSDVSFNYVKENYEIEELVDLFFDGTYRVIVKEKSSQRVIGVTECTNNVWRIKSDHGFEVNQLEKAVKRVVDVYLRFHVDFLETEKKLTDA